MLKLLFIEDEQDTIEPILKLIEDQEDMRYEVCGFEDAEDRIVSLHPNIVILDLLVGGASPEPEVEGLNTRNFIWNQHFCPIVVYSARPDIHDEKCDPHPFVKSIQKGSDSPQKVMKVLNELYPQVQALREGENHIKHHFSCAMREVAPYAFDAFPDDKQRIETIKRSGRRRLAALMDEPLPDGKVLAGWEQYLFPPVSDDTQLGDVLKVAEGKDDDPTLFRVILTPSCDLVRTDGRKPKVSQVLVAKCCSMKNGLDRTSLGKIEIQNMGKTKIQNLEDRLRSVMLTQGYFETLIPFPRLKGKIPTMTANLRDLELIGIEDIGNLDSHKPFLRVASVDIPFRELIAWAYLQTACRPGLPDRNFAEWCQEIIKNLQSEDSE